MKRATRLLAVSCLLAGSPFVNAEVTANIGFTSDYIWRGVSQTGNSAAVSGGIDWGHESGFYLGTWVSNVTGGYELDLYGGFAGNAGDVGYDLGAIYYGYTDSANADFLELAASASWKWLKVGANYTVDGDASTPAQFSGGDLYYYGALSFDLPQDFGVALTAGQYRFDDDGKAGVGEVDYTHFQVDVSKSAGEFGDFSLSASKADKQAGNPNGDDPLFFVSWSKSF